MNTGTFIGGVLTGVLGLAAAAFINNQITEAKFSPNLKRADELDEEQVVHELNSFFFKAQEIYGKCNEVVLEATDLIVTPIELPWDNFIQKGMNSIGGKLTKWCRSWRARELLSLGEEMNKLYERYLPIFKRANSLLIERGLAPINLSPKLVLDDLNKPNTSLDNDDWDIELGEIADSIINFIEESCNQAEKLIESLEGLSSNPSLKAIAQN